MRNIIFCLSAIVLAILIGLFSCQKNKETSAKLSVRSLTKEAAIEWHEKNQLKIIADKGLARYSKKMIPKWDKAVLSEDENYEIVECPLTFENNMAFGFLDSKKTGENNNNNTNGTTRLLILKSKTNDAVTGALMHIYSKSGKLTPDYSYMTGRNNFSGYVFYTDLNLQFVNGWQYKDGKIVKSTNSSKNISFDNQRAVPINEGCTTIQISVYERYCDYYSNGIYNCTDWELIEVIYQTYCPATGGGGGYEEPSDPNACLNACQSQLSGNAHVSSELISENVVYIDPIRREKNPQWMCLKNLTWALFSHEKGIVKLVDPSANKWQWESLTHNTITKSGMSVGGTVTPSTGIGTASFVPGTQNILYAGMSVTFDVTYAPACDCPGINLLLPPYTIPYTANKIFSAKP